jgi:hypothetical protein
MTEGPESRFVRLGSIPPVYLSCSMNYILDDDDSAAPESLVAPCPRIETYEPAIESQQEMCADEAKEYEEVKWCLHPKFGCNWLGYFNHYFVLEQFFELWKGDTFVGTSEFRPKPASSRLDCFLCYTLSRSSLSNFEKDSSNSDSFGGCVVVFRQLAPNSQLFGVWFLWLRIEGILMVVDLQNSNVSRSLQAAVTALGWNSPPMIDVFYAPFKRDLFRPLDRKSPKKSRSKSSEAYHSKFKVAKGEGH